MVLTINISIINNKYAKCKLKKKKKKKKIKIKINFDINNIRKVIGSKYIFFCI